MEGKHAAGPDPDETVVMQAVDPDATVLLPAFQPTAATVPGPPPAAEDSTASVTRNSAVMAVGSLVSRLTGFVRTVAIGAAIGAKAFSDDYTLANTLPNMVYELLLGGVLASVVVPLLVRARTRDTDRGEAYAQRLLSLATVFLAGATVVAVLLAPLLTELVAGSSSAVNKHLTTVLGYLLLPEIFFYGIAALLSAILNTRGHFAAPMWTPILNNVVVIATAGAFMLIWTNTKELTPEEVTTGQILVLGVGTTLGIVVQAGGLLPRMSAAAAEHRYADVAAQLSLGTRLSAVILIPATALYVVLGRQLGVALFEFRSYGHADSVTTGWVIAAAGIGLVPFAISQLQIFAFYALPDTKTPALLNVPVAALRILVDVLLYVGLAAGAVAAGLMIGNAVSFVAACALGYWLLRRRLGPLGLREVLTTLLRLTVAAVIAAVPAGLVTLLLVHAIGLGKLASVVELIVGGLMLVIVYLAAAVSLKVREVSDVWGMVRSRLRR